MGRKVVENKNRNGYMDGRIEKMGVFGKHLQWS